ncbi:MAG: cytidine deaminase [Actinomycetota bacterium]
MRTLKEEELIEIAKQARLKAYAPYSNFRVGAALLASDGRIFTGCNIENASYGLSICAERVALLKAVSEGCSDFIKLVIVTDTKEPCSPCGACRQVLFEFNPDISILMVNLEGKQLVMTARELLPKPFVLG